MPYRPSHLRSSPPPRWLMAALMLCLGLVIAALILRPDLSPTLPAQAAEPIPVPTVTPGPAATLEPAVTVEPSATPEPTVTVEPSATPEPTVTVEPTATQEPAATPEPTAPVEPTATSESAATPEPTATLESTAEPDWSLPVPLGEEVDEEDWFSNAIIIGDSRTEGLRIYSGITSKANFVTYTGLSIRGVNENARVIRIGEEKYPVLDFLAAPSYGKIYLALGLNDLGRGSEDFLQSFGQVVDRVRALQPEARIYIQSILPVNTDLCQSHGYSITNPRVDEFNQTLSSLCQEKEVYLLGVPEALLDENGELSSSLTSDGVHLQKTGSALWLSYLLTHTGG